MTKKPISSIAKTDTYKSLSTFSSVKEMNLALKHYQIKFDAELTNTEKSVLVTLSHYSCIYPGVSFCANEKLVSWWGKVDEPSFVCVIVWRHSGSFDSMV